MGTFRRLVFCVVGTQLVGKTQFFDRLKSHFLFHLLELILDSGIFCAVRILFSSSAAGSSGVSFSDCIAFERSSIASALSSMRAIASPSRALARRRRGCPSRSRPFPAHGRAPSCSEWPHGAGAASPHRKPVCRAPDAYGAPSFHAQRRTSSEALSMRFSSSCFFARNTRASSSLLSWSARRARSAFFALSWRFSSS